MTIPNLQPPSRSEQSNTGQQTRTETHFLIMIGIIICLILVILAMLIMPSPSDIIEVNEQPIEKKTVQKKIIAISTQAEEKIFNKKQEIDWMLKKTDAEAINLPIWSEKEYQRAINSAKEAEQFKKQQQFDSAEKSYKNAIDILDKVIGEKDRKLQSLIKKGSIALENNKLIQASELFKKAQSIEPENEEIVKSLFRIEHRYEVEELYQLAIKNEKSNELNKAINNLENALAIEPEFSKASIRLSKIRKKISEIEFKKSVNNILEALDNNDLKEAEQSLLKLKSIEPEHPVIKELTDRINSLNKTLAIKRLQISSVTQEKNEQWNKALNSYQKILKHDPNTSSAIVNKERVKSYIKINTILDNIILKPERLENKKILNSSKQSIENIESELKQKDTLYYPLSNTPKMNQKIMLAKTLISEASKEIPVTIISDNETDIAIYKIGKFGTLKEKKLFLRPGNYTIVGSRNNFRDYRQIIKIKSSDQSRIINVQCREKI